MVLCTLFIYLLFIKGVFSNQNFHLIKIDYVNCVQTVEYSWCGNYTILQHIGCPLVPLPPLANTICKPILIIGVV